MHTTGDLLEANCAIELGEEGCLKNFTEGYTRISAADPEIFLTGKSSDFVDVLVVTLILAEVSVIGPIGTRIA